LGAASWAEREDLVRTHAGHLIEHRREELGLAQVLYPEVDALGHLASLLDDVAARGLDTVLTEHREASDHADLVRRWLATPTWSDSRDLLQHHPELTSDPRTLAALQAGADDPMVAQHLGIARLTTRMPVAEVYDAVTDLAIAVDTAMDCVERGDIATLSDLWLAVPRIGRLPFVGPFLLASYTVLADLEEPIQDVTTLIQAAAEQGSDTQRTAGTARLRRLARRRPEHAPSLNTLANLLTALNRDPTPDPDTNAAPTA